MILRLVLAVSLALALPACGTKSDLVKPNGEKASKSEKNPSQPPNPITR